MLWMLVSAGFLWCAFREVRGALVPPPGLDSTQPIYLPYLLVMLALAAAFAFPPVQRWHFEHFLAVRATVLADGHRARVHCNTMFDTMMDSEVFAAGHANPATGQIGIQVPWCDTLRSYLRHPARANRQELQSLDMITHESMHVRGELDEARTECQAVQRNYRAAKLLGVKEATAKRNALDYYDVLYQERRQIGGLQAAYYSDQCAPGKAWDEHLPDSTWGP
jgi:hypothetical protein